MCSNMLTCSVCCCNTLRRIKKGLWECEVCGTSFDFNKLRNSLDKLVGQQLQEDFIEELLRKAKPIRVLKLDERAWKWKGKYGILYTLDTGNGWHLVMKALKPYHKF